MHVSVVEQYGRCEICKGTGTWRGVFHKGACAACNGVGVVHQSGEAMTLEQGIEYLRNQLAAHPQGPSRDVIASDAELYQQPNSKGPGGSHYAGD